MWLSSCSSKTWWSSMAYIIIPMIVLSNSIWLWPVSGSKNMTRTESGFPKYCSPGSNGRASLPFYPLDRIVVSICYSTDFIAAIAFSTYPGSPNGSINSVICIVSGPTNNLLCISGYFMASISSFHCPYIYLTASVYNGKDIKWVYSLFDPPPLCLDLYCLISPSVYVFSYFFSDLGFETVDA